MTQKRNHALFLSFLCIASGAFAQAPGTSNGRPEFEVASIKPNTGGGRGVMIRVLYGGRLNAENTPLKVLIRVAYNVENFQISGGPGWINSDPYDVNAKAESEAAIEQMRPMLQSLLADRFKLAVHRETKESPVYELGAAKGGPKLTASKEGSCITPDRNNPPPPPRPGGTTVHFCDNIRMGRGLVDAFGISMPKLVEALANTVGRTVIDKTGFTGKFDVHLEFTPDEGVADAIARGGVGQAAPAPSTDSAAPSIFTALQEQLGLRLESAKGPVEMLVIDHVERPSEN